MLQSHSGAFAFTARCGCAQPVSFRKRKEFLLFIFGHDVGRGIEPRGGRCAPRLCRNVFLTYGDFVLKIKGCRSRHPFLCMASCLNLRGHAGFMFHKCVLRHFTQIFRQLPSASRTMCMPFALDRIIRPLRS